MTTDEFADLLEGFGERISNLNDDLLAIGGRLVSELKGAAPSNTGALTNSIQAVVENNSLSIEMLAYGIFQNYGVDGMSQAVADPVPSFGVLQPRTGNRFGFSGDYEMIGGDLPIGARKKIYQLGLKPQRWFNLDDLTDAVTEEIAIRTTEL
jgi:hypothetical protein